MNGYKETGLRQENMLEHPDQEPIRCPQCGGMRLSGPTCPHCGYTHQRRSRMVVQIDGTLKCVEGPSYKPHRVAMKPDTKQLFERMYHRAKSKKFNATPNQACALFFLENHYYPPKDIPYMPKDPIDFFEKYSNIPPERLIG